MKLLGFLREWHRNYTWHYSRFQRTALHIYIMGIMAIIGYSFFLCTAADELCRLYGALPAFPWYIIYYKPLESVTNNDAIFGLVLVAAFVLNGYILLRLVRSIEETFHP